MSDEYLCLTVLSRPGESEGEFKTRLSEFWTHMLRDHKSDFEKVYAETTQFSESAGRKSRQYLVEADVIDTLERELASPASPMNPSTATTTIPNTKPLPQIGCGSSTNRPMTSQ
jgi:hypothetical protein